jgi:hypothetical protein
MPRIASLSNADFTKKYPDEQLQISESEYLLDLHNGQGVHVYGPK